MSADERLTALGLTLPSPPKPIGNYVPFRLAGNLLFLSGVGPRRHDETMITGKVGAEVSVEQGYEAAKLCGINLLVNMIAAVGTLERVDTVLKVLGMVNAVSDFERHPEVINGCTDLFVQVLGEGGRPARSAVGMGSLPRNISVEVEAIVLVKGAQWTRRPLALKPALTAAGAISAFPGRQKGAAGAVKAAMSNDLIVTPVAAAVAATEPAGQTKVAAGAAAVEPQTSVASAVGPNPSLELDPALGLVVIEFRNDAGAVTTSIPTEQQLLAYQRWAATHFGPAPPGMPSTNTGVANATTTQPRETPASSQKTNVEGQVPNGERTHG